MSDDDSDPFESILTSGSQDILRNHGDGCSVENIKVSSQVKLHESERNKNKPKLKSQKRIPNWRSEVDMKCELCPFSTRYKCDFRRHKARHVTASFPCQQCNMPFFTEGHMNGHIRTAHGKNEVIKTLKCSICNYETSHASDIAKHRRRHQDCLVECRHCRRPYLDEGRYKLHLRKHHGTESVMDTDVMKDAWEKLKHKTQKKHRKEISSKPLTESENDAYVNKQLKGNAEITDDYNIQEKSNGDKGQLKDTEKRKNSREASPQKDRPRKHSSKRRMSKKQHKTDVANVKSNCLKHEIENMHNDKTTYTLTENDVARLPMRNNERSPVKFTKHTARARKHKLMVASPVDIVSANDEESNVANEVECTEHEKTSSITINHDMCTNKNKYPVASESKHKPVASSVICCVFCDYEAHSYGDLTKHLDDHDMEELYNTIDGPSDLDQSSSNLNGHYTSSASEDENYDEDRDIHDDDDDENKNPLVESDAELKGDSNMAGEDTAEWYECDKDMNIKDGTNKADTHKKMGTDSHGDIPDRNPSTDINDRTAMTPLSCDTHVNCSNNKNIDDTSANHKTQRGIGDSATITALVTKPYACSMCTFRTGDVRMLEAHVDTHNASMLLNCHGKEKERIELTIKHSKHDSRLNTLQDKHPKSPARNDCKPKLNQHSHAAKKIDRVLVNRHRVSKHSQKAPGHMDRRHSHGRKTDQLTEFDKLTGRLSKRDFVRYKRFYARRTWIAHHGRRTSSRSVYECLICKPGTRFDTSSEARTHYKRAHQQLRERICDTCSYCSRPFP